MNELLQQTAAPEQQIEQICTAAGSVLAIILAVIRARRSARRKRRAQRKAGG